VWPSTDLDSAEVSLEWQVQRVGRQLIHKQQLKTDGSTDILPLPDICLAALRLQPPGFNCKPVISGFSCVRGAELLVYIRGHGAGLHPLGAAD
jgi:hypothetical protein